MTTFKYKGVTLEVVQGDITKQSVDVIVNAANSSLLGGGGVDGAIHRAAGPTLLDACRDIRNAQGKCATGDVVATHAGALDAQHVFHTVGPVWQDGLEGEFVLLESCYRKSMDLAKSMGLGSIAFPAISTGVYRFPFDRAAYVAVRAAVLFLDETPEPGLKHIRYILFSKQDYESFTTIFNEVTRTMTG